MPRHQKYEANLRSLMSFVHRLPKESPYLKGKTFLKEQLLELRPEHIRDWLSMKAFGKVEWRYEDGDRPTFYRSTSMEVSKKSVSYFMPNKHPQWCNGQGNPLKSELITGLIQFVKK